MLPAFPFERVLHVDDDLIVVDKPSGLLSVTGRGPAGEDCVHARLLSRWPDALVVHRLDMATSGLMVFARGIDAQRALSRSFARREVHKRYRAVVAGEPSRMSGCPQAAGGSTGGASTLFASWSVIALPLSPDWPNRPRQKVDPVAGRPSTTRWRPLGRADGPWGAGTLLELEPVTGRSHQLRVHLMSIGHPIVGDALYSPDAIATASPRLFLHATALVFDHPRDARRRSFGCPAPF